MKRIYFIISMVIAVATCTLAQLTPASAARLKLKAPHTPRMAKIESDEDEDSTPKYYPVMMAIEDGSYALEQLSELGTVFYRNRGDIWLCSIPREKVEDVLQVPGIIEISCASTSSINMDMARQFTNTDVVQAGTGFDMPYDGTGVVAGFADIGFYPSHIAFGSRVAAVADFTPEDDISAFAITPAELNEWITDHPEQTHATHVANIFAGSYRPLGYHGVATGATIVGTTSSLYDVGILQGVEYVIDYAKEHGMPAVINLSLASHMGPHDGTSLFSEYLQRLSDEAVICLSSSNYGNRYIHGHHTFSETSTLCRTTVGSMSDWSNFTVSGMIDIWSADSRTFKARCEIYDDLTNSIVFTSDWLTPDNEDGMLEINPNPEFMDGKMYLYCAHSPRNGRYNVTASIDITTEAVSHRGPWNRYGVVLAFSAEPDVTIDVYADTQPLMLGFLPAGFDMMQISTDGSASDMCSAPGVISVGSCNSRNTTPSIDGEGYTFNNIPGNVSEFSSYSSATPFCRPLPDICAPGNIIISATSTPYVENGGNHNLVTKTTIDGRDYYWHAENGTSMSCPHAAGIFAIWLQADPSLTALELRDIAMRTARTDFSDYPSPRWGAGCIDAEAGLREVLAGVSHLPSVTIPESTESATYTLSGIRLPDNTDLTPGIYIRIENGTARKLRIN